VKVEAADVVAAAAAAEVEVNIPVAVLGAAGRMGRTVCEAVLGDPDLDLVAAVDPNLAGTRLSEMLGGQPTDLEVTADLATVAAAGAAVTVDFTDAAAAKTNLEWLASEAINAVVGTTGFAPADFEQISGWFDRSGCIIAPNFAISAVLMMRFAELAAPYFESAEVIELHHEAKVDAPSGTAAATVDRIVAASDDWLADPTTHETIAGTRGGSKGGVHVHSVRLRGLVAHQEVILGATGQSLTIRQDSYDRTSFMPGVILAVKAVSDGVGLTVGLDELLGI
jgi:4-hydroxy-tetrahydrodipicolinate reductase